MALHEPIEVGPGHTYRVTKKLNCMEQFHVTRRLGPALVIAGVSFKMLMNGENISMDALVSVAGPVMQIISRMSDDDVEYIIRTCLKTVERMQNGAFAPVLTADGSAFMFADMDQAEMIRMTVEVIQNNLENFMPGVNEGGSLKPASATAAHP
jgi:hypothetical protein